MNISNKQRLVVFMFLLSLQSIAANLAHPITPTLISDLNLGDYMFGVAFASMSITNFLFSPFWGKMINVISEKNSMMIGCIGYAVAQFMFMNASTESDIIIARCLAGVFLGGVTVASLTYTLYISDSSTSARNLTFQATISTVMGTIGYFIGGMIGDISIYYSFILQVISLASVGILYKLMLKSRDNMQKLSLKELSKEANPLKSMFSIRPFLNHLLVLLFLVTFISSLATTAYDQSFNYYIKDIFNFPPSYNGIIKAVVGLVSLVTNLTICIWIIKRKNISFSLYVIFMTCSISLIGVIFAKNVTQFLLVNLVFFAANSIYIPLLQNSCSKYSNSESSSIVMGFYNSVKSLGMIVGALIAGFSYTLNPIQPFLYAIVFFFLSAFFIFIYYRKEKTFSK